MSEDDLWQIFAETGRVCDYLNYKERLDDYTGGDRAQGTSRG